MPPKRSKIMHIDTVALFDRLIPHAQASAELKEPAFLWTGADYIKSRGCGPDRDHLQVVWQVLLEIAGCATNGYPNHSELRQVWIELDVRCGISQVKCSSLRFSTANDARDMWRLMLKHCMQI